MIQETTTQVSATFKTMIEETSKILESHSQFLKITKEERMEKLEGITKEDLRTLETTDQISKVKELKEIEVLTCNQSMIKILPLVGHLETQKSLPRAKVEFYWEGTRSWHVQHHQGNQVVLKILGNWKITLDVLEDCCTSCIATTLLAIMVAILVLT